MEAEGIADPRKAAAAEGGGGGPLEAGAKWKVVQCSVALSRCPIYTHPLHTRFANMMIPLSLKR